MEEEQSFPKKRTPSIQRRSIDLRPDFLFGYILGLIIGDGWVEKTKSRNYVIGLETTREDYAELFASCLRRRFPNLRIFRYERMKLRRFPNGSSTSSKSIMQWVNCKDLYLILRPCKLSDFHWRVPDLVLGSKEATRGFLCGIFDAEASVDVDYCQVKLFSKHRGNLRQILRLLLGFGIKSFMQKARSELKIVSRGNCIRFQKEVGFCYLPKKTRLAEICKVKYGPTIVEQARELRESGLTYLEIAKILGVASETSIGEWLRGEKLPHSVRFGWPVE